MEARKELEPYLNKVIQGNTLTVLKKIPDNSIDCVITSPPYWALRNYEIEPVVWGDGWKGSLGLEPTIDLFIKHLIQVFDEIKRVLKPTGTCFVNLGDSYNNNTARVGRQDKSKYGGKSGTHCLRGGILNYPAKSLCLIPFRFAIEMVNRGWILRNTIIWHKPNCMPASAKDRFTVDFEYVFFFVKNKKYFFEQQYEPRLTQEKIKYNSNEYWLSVLDGGGKQREAKKYFEEWLKENPNGTYQEFYEQHKSKKISKYANEKWKDVKDWESHFKNYCAYLGMPHPLGRNLRCVWRIPTQPFKDAHFAVFPEKLVEPMIKSGCPERVCNVCGLPEEKIIKINSVPTRPARIMGTGKSGKDDDPNKQLHIRDPQRHIKIGIDIIGRTSCGHNNYTKGIVLDPFAGSGTTCVVAKKLGRDYIGIELKKEYVEIAIKRINSVPPNLFNFENGGIK